MINTVNIKEQQLKRGYFKTGNGPDHIFIMGSCRVINYVNYFAAMPQFTVYTVDPFNWNWDKENNRTDYMAAIEAQEKNTELINVLKNCTIFIHEYYENAGMFNCSASDKNIYQFGLNPEVDICIPNFNDLFILYADIISFDVGLRKKAIQDYNVIGKLTDQTLSEIAEISNNNLSKFYQICHYTSFPEMASWFGDNYKLKRLFWNSNHVTKAFTLQVFKMLNDKYFAGKLTVDESHNDMFNNNYTYLTEYDYTFKWPEQIKKLSL